MCAVGWPGGALGSRGLGAGRLPTGCLQSVEVGSACVRGVGVGPPLPAAQPPAAWPHAGSPPRRGMGREERRRVGDRHSLCKHSYRRRQTAAGGGRLPPLVTEGWSDPSAAVALSLFYPLPGGYGPSRAERDGEAKASGPARPAHRPGGQPGFPCEPGRRRRCCQTG